MLRRRTHLKLVLAMLIAIGGIGSLTISSTYAILTAEETNPGSSAASGTLTLGNTVNAGTTCYSYGAGSSGNANAACSPLMSSATLQYPGSTATANVAISDDGSLDGSDLALYMPACAVTTSPGAPHSGGGDPCAEVTDGSGNPDGLVLTIQETDASGNPTFCWYPDQVSGSCTADPNFSAYSPNSFGLFAEYATSAGASLDLGPGPAHGQTRYFQIGVSLPTNADNSLQGEQATFDLTWHITT